MTFVPSPPVARLVSDQSSHLTGTTVIVDGSTDL
jgi:hypothetical protein